MQTSHTEVMEFSKMAEMGPYARMSTEWPSPVWVSRLRGKAVDLIHMCSLYLRAKLQMAWYKYRGGIWGSWKRYSGLVAKGPGCLRVECGFDIIGHKQEPQNINKQVTIYCWLEKCLRKLNLTLQVRIIREERFFLKSKWKHSDCCRLGLWSEHRLS